MIPIVKALAGSRLYGTAQRGSDLDFMGIGVASQQEKLGLAYVEQIGADDDVTYELAKWTRLAMNGNPTVLQMLWVDGAEQVLDCHRRWPEWQSRLRRLVLSQRCITAFLGYLEGQRKKILSDRQQRPELIAQYGFDTKFAAHMVRLGLQGVEVAMTGQMILPCPQAQLLNDIRRGKYSLHETLDMAADLEHTLKTVESILPVEPNRNSVNELLVEIYQECWK